MDNSTTDVKISINSTYGTCETDQKIPVIKKK